METNRSRISRSFRGRVLTQGKAPENTDSLDARVQRGWIDLQRGFAQRSSLGRQIVVTKSGHGIPLEAPSAVIGAVHELVADIRTHP